MGGGDEGGSVLGFPLGAVDHDFAVAVEVALVCGEGLALVFVARDEEGSFPLDGDGIEAGVAGDGVVFAVGGGGVVVGVGGSVLELAGGGEGEAFGGGLVGKDNIFGRFAGEPGLGGVHFPDADPGIGGVEEGGGEEGDEETEHMGIMRHLGKS